MAVLARATRGQLAALWEAHGGGHRPAVLLGPETGLVRLTTQAGQSGPRFQFGEATVSRCLVGQGAARGYAAHLGSDLDKAHLAACLDLIAQAQDPVLCAAIAALAQGQNAQDLLRHKTAQATKVRFYTTKTSANSTS